MVMNEYDDIFIQPTTVST